MSLKEQPESIPLKSRYQATHCFSGSHAKPRSQTLSLSSLSPGLKKTGFGSGTSMMPYADKGLAGKVSWSPSMFSALESPSVSDSLSAFLAVLLQARYIHDRMESHSG